MLYNVKTEEANSAPKRARDGDGGYGPMRKSKHFAPHLVVGFRTWRHSKLYYSTVVTDQDKRFGLITSKCH